jgi:hypothetical protein
MPLLAPVTKAFPLIVPISTSLEYSISDDELKILPR